MYLKFIICVSILQFLLWTPVESNKKIYLDYHYETEAEVAKPVCTNNDEYVVTEGEDVTLYVKRVEKIIFKYSRCTLQRNTSFVTANSFYTCCGSSMFRIKLKHVISAPYNCSFYVLKEEGKSFEPTAIFNNVTYVRLSWIFNLKVYREKPILLTADIDGEILTPSRKSINNVIKSEYKYNKEQKLMVTCKKHEATEGIVELSIPDSNRQSNESKLLISTTNLQVSNPQVLGPYFSIKCMLREHNEIFEVYDIYFAPKREPTEIDVEGLPLSNIIENKDDNRFMYYKYTDFELINMKCSMVCPHELCSMDISYNAKKVNNTQWIYGRKIDLSHLFLLRPADNSSIIECTVYHDRKTEGISRFKFIYITLLYVNENRKQSTSNLRPNGCFDPSTGADVKCTRSNTLPTISPANSSQSTTASHVPKSSVWLIASEIVLVQAVIVLIVCLACAYRRRSKQKLQRPQLPLSESLELDAFPSASNNAHEYEEIPEAVTNPVIPDKLQLSLIPDMKLDPHNGRLIVRGKPINLHKMLEEAEYVEIK